MSEKHHSPALANELESLSRMIEVMSLSLNFQQTLAELLKTLHESAAMQQGMITLVDEESGDLIVTALHQSPLSTQVRYRPGEGVNGQILESGQSWVVPRISEEPHFLDRLGIYDRNRPYMAVPIFIAGETAGVLAAQPLCSSHELAQKEHFLRIIANLIGVTLRLERQMKDEQMTLKQERDLLRRKIRGEHGFASMVGHSRAMQHVFEQVRQVAKWNTTVLIRGESGTGKELIANAIHYNSPRASGPFIKLNCAALPDTLLESELFGNENGAFTGAINQRKGRFEQAHGGSIFLDEIGEISPTFQAKLLRVLQEGEFERLGGMRTISVDVRIITATNKNLEAEVQDRHFREDLYYRLNVMPIHTPPLRDRIEDIPDLVHFLLKKIASNQGRPVDIADNALALLMQHHWPGNVRELENHLERAAVMSHAGHIDARSLQLSGIEHSLHTPPLAKNDNHPPPFEDPDLDERERVIAALEEAGWVQAKAARLLGMTPRQIGYRIQILNIKMRQI
ncbi:MAG: nif-specific transcriptional activator NifA [Gammaproteobacteria bacterium]|nr:nif-specific transcriptional activator NifA [Gammaproteobacteria bacterium]